VVDLRGRLSSGLAGMALASRVGAVGVAPAMGRLSRAVMGKVKNEEREGHGRRLACGKRKGAVGRSGCR
jgi:hypothetical protein